MLQPLGNLLVRNMSADSTASTALRVDLCLRCLFPMESKRIHRRVRRACRRFRRLVLLRVCPSGLRHDSVRRRVRAIHPLFPPASPCCPPPNHCRITEKQKAKTDSITTDFTPPHIPGSTKRSTRLSTTWPSVEVSRSTVRSAPRAIPSSASPTELWSVT